jgi:hypothetical protein
MLVESHTTAITPFDNHVFFVSLLNYGKFSIRFFRIAQALDAISGITLLTGRRGPDERWLLRTF